MASQRPPSASGSHGAVSPPSLFSAVRVCSSAWGTAACPTQPDALVEVWGDQTGFPGAVAASRAAARLACASPPSTSAYVTRASPAQGLPRPHPGRFLGPQLSAPASRPPPPVSPAARASSGAGSVQSVPSCRRMAAHPARVGDTVPTRPPAAALRDGLPDARRGGPGGCAGRNIYSFDLSRLR